MGLCNVRGSCSYGGFDEARKRGFGPPLGEAEQTRNDDGDRVERARPEGQPQDDHRGLFHLVVEAG